MTELLLIRHGQASFAAADYDQLSPIGDTQSRMLGAWLVANEDAPALIASGRLRRHAQTISACVESAGRDAPRLLLDGLDELDHRDILQQHRPDLQGHAAIAAEVKRSDDPHRAFQQLFADAVTRWTGGQHDHEYARSWPTFHREIVAALHTLTTHATDADGPTCGPIWVITSGGPIAVMVGELLGLPMGRTFELSWPLVNTSLTRVAVGRRQRQLVTYNAWPHLTGHPDLITHR